MSDSLHRLYPELNAGGFTRTDGTLQFYIRVNALLHPDMTVLDLGAGRGAQFENMTVPIRSALIKLQGKVREVVGADVDSAVLENQNVDRSIVIEVNRPLPFEDGAFDLVICDWVLEHVANPDGFAQEVFRVLKPGGWFCARTPNRWGIKAIGATLIPNSLHARVLKRLTPERQEQDVFPTLYRLNTRTRIRFHFDRRRWENYSYVANGEPPYVARSWLASRAVLLYWRLVPEALYTNLLVFLRKKLPSTAVSAE